MGIKSPEAALTPNPRLAFRSTVKLGRVGGLAESVNPPLGVLLVAINSLAG